MTSTGVVYFSKFPVTTQIFYQTRHTFAIVNLRPIVPGHILVIPRRVVPTITDLPIKEAHDFMTTIQKMTKLVRLKYGASATNLGIQDGLAAGQSVPHVHCHIIPRYLKDGFGDDIYQILEQWEGGLVQYAREEKLGSKALVPDQPWYEQVWEGVRVLKDEDRIDRTMQTMENEARELEQFIKDHENELELDD